MKTISLLGIDVELIKIIAGDPEGFSDRYGASLGECVEEARDVVRQTEAFYRRVPRDPPWIGYLVVNTDTVVVGCCGFVPAPLSEGTIEIAYGTWPSFQRQGYATAAALALIEIASKSGMITRVIAHTLPEPGASTRVLRRLGMVCRGEIEHPEDGKVWLWEKRLKKELG
ncbi:MAG: GNAT family N-acetyltransferase [Verrucomicrobia bacterium]|nr:MAG: GNAT family N-acetyltransferase [Verrucomicrobiota bacterium]